MWQYELSWSRFPHILPAQLSSSYWSVRFLPDPLGWHSFAVDYYHTWHKVNASKLKLVLPPGEHFFHYRFLQYGLIVHTKDSLREPIGYDRDPLHLDNSCITAGSGGDGYFSLFANSLQYCGIALFPLSFKIFGNGFFSVFGICAWQLSLLLSSVLRPNQGNEYTTWSLLHWVLASMCRPFHQFVLAKVEKVIVRYTF